MGRTPLAALVVLTVSTHLWAFGAAEEGVPVAEYEALEAQLAAAEEREAELRADLEAERGETRRLVAELEELRERADLLDTRLADLQEAISAQREADRFALERLIDRAFTRVDSRFALPPGVVVERTDRPGILLARDGARTVFTHIDANRTRAVPAAIEVSRTAAGPTATLLLQLDESDAERVRVFDEVVVSGAGTTVAVAPQTVERLRDAGGYLQRATIELSVTTRELVRAVLASDAVIAFTDDEGRTERRVDAEVRAALAAMLFLHRRLGGTL